MSAGTDRATETWANRGSPDWRDENSALGTGCHSRRVSCADRPLFAIAPKGQKAVAWRREPQVRARAHHLAPYPTFYCLKPRTGRQGRAARQQFEKRRTVASGFATVSLLRSSVSRKSRGLRATTADLGLTPPGYDLPPHSRLEPVRPAPLPAPNTQQIPPLLGRADRRYSTAFSSAQVCTPRIVNS